MKKRGPYDPIKVAEMNRKWAEEMRKDGVKVIENWKPDNPTTITKINSTDKTN